MTNKKDYEKYTGAVNISADITPITREPIGQITPEKWNTMDDSSLWEQRITLTNRLFKAQQCGSADLGPQIQAGINQIDAILQRNADRDKKIREDSSRGTMI